MKQNYEIQNDDATADNTIRIFKCPVCGGHNLQVTFEVYGMRQIVGTRSDADTIFGQADTQGTNHGTCHCTDCEWEGEFSTDDNPERCFAQHLQESRELIFTCPMCGSHELRYIRQGHTTSYPVSAIYEEEGGEVITMDFDTLDRDDRGGEVFYSCGSCWSPLIDDKGRRVTEEGEVLLWLFERR
jgi:Zn finger protein HypA/HybF involved in hydrogenase expression